MLGIALADSRGMAREQLRNHGQGPSLWEILEPNSSSDQQKIAPNFLAQDTASVVVCAQIYEFWSM
jgi:hypothetical protein